MTTAIAKSRLNASFASELYPTPEWVIEKMLSPYVDQTFKGTPALRCDRMVLDPSAGRGSILDFVNTKFSWQRIELLACEIEQDLRYILSEKDYQVIASDWLEFDEPRMFPFIVMNPPFSQGAKHVLHAWRHLAPDGHLVALVNAETLNNACSGDRQELVSLIDLHGSAEALGAAFKDSDRPTNVEVAIVRLHKPTDSTRIEFEGFNFEQDPEIEFGEFNENPLARRDIIKNLVTHYNAAREILLQRHHSQTRLDWSLRGIDQVYGGTEKYLEMRESLESQIQALKARFWATVFTRSEIGKQLTSNFERDFTEFQRSQKQMAFTEANIVEVLEMFFFNRGEILQKCIVEVFDKLTRHHENCLQGAWKTNASYKVNQKVIFPYGITYEKLWGFQLGHGMGRQTYNDLDKVLKYINGDSDICTITDAIEKHIREIKGDKAYSDPFESSYFSIKIFKKGTVHLKFLDLKLWEEFNRRAAIGKQWIGPDY